MLKIWVLRREPSGKVQSEKLGFVIVARTEAHARRLARDGALNEGNAVWDVVPCQYLGDAAPGVQAGIVLSDFQEP